MEDKILKSFEMIVAGKPEQAYLLNFDFALDALTAMAERRFEVVWSNPTHMPPFFMMYVDDTGMEKAKVKAEKFMREVCAERDWDFAGFTMKSIEEYLFCDDPRFGER